MPHASAEILLVCYEKHHSQGGLRVCALFAIVLNLNTVCNPYNNSDEHRKIKANIFSQLRRKVNTSKLYENYNTPLDDLLDTRGKNNTSLYFSNNGYTI